MNIAIYQSNNNNHTEIKQFMNHQSREECILGKAKLLNKNKIEDLLNLFPSGTYTGLTYQNVT
jgi:hypothetical protein